MSVFTFNRLWERLKAFIPKKTINFYIKNVKIINFYKTASFIERDYLFLQKPIAYENHNYKRSKPKLTR